MTEATRAAITPSHRRRGRMAVVAVVHQAPGHAELDEALAALGTAGIDPLLARWRRAPGETARLGATPRSPGPFPVAGQAPAAPRTVRLGLAAIDAVDRVAGTGRIVGVAGPAPHLALAGADVGHLDRGMGRRAGPSRDARRVGRHRDLGPAETEGRDRAVVVPRTAGHREHAFRACHRGRRGQAHHHTDPEHGRDGTTKPAGSHVTERRGTPTANPADR